MRPSAAYIFYSFTIGCYFSAIKGQKKSAKKEQNAEKEREQEWEKRVKKIRSVHNNVLFLAANKWKVFQYHCCWVFAGKSND